MSNLPGWSSHFASSNICYTSHTENHALPIICILQKILFHTLMLTIKKLVQVLLKTRWAVKQAVMDEVDWEKDARWWRSFCASGPLMLQSRLLPNPSSSPRFQVFFEAQKRTTYLQVISLFKKARRCLWESSIPKSYQVSFVEWIYEWLTCREEK